MFTVYALNSPSFNKINIGFTSDLEQRLLSHNCLATKGYTIKFRPWTMVYSENHSTKAQAMLREKQLKSAQGRDFIKNIINTQLINL